MSLNQKILSSSLTIILLLTLVTNQGYAQLTEKELSWQMIYLSDKTACNVTEERKVKDIVGIIEKYFTMYKINNQKFGTTCLYSEEFFDNTISNDVDLNILVFDEKIGQKLFLKYGYNGMYAHFGSDRMNNHVIMVAVPPQYSSAYENTELPWSLSEKLSQFILSYYGYNLESITRMLDNKSEYQECVKRAISNEECNQITASIHSDISGDDYSVLAPLKEIVNQKSIKYLPDDLCSSQVTKDVLHKITNWWVNELIDDQMYLERIKQIVNVPIKNNKVSNTQIYIPNGFSIISNANDNMIQKNNEKSKIIPTENEFYTILNYVPFDTNVKISESESLEIPTWFKNRAVIWQDGKLGDRVFFAGLTALIQNGHIEEN